MKIAHSLPELIGNTPLLAMERFAKGQGISSEILGKLEYFNPLGSAKDRIGLAFGSYGWSGEATKQVDEIMQGLGWHTMPIRKQLYRG